MQIAGKKVWDILHQHGWSPNPEGYINPFFVEQEGDKLYTDVNSAAIRYGNKPDEMPDYPVRIFLRPLNSSTGTVGLDAIEVRELKKGEFSKAEARRDFYPKISPWLKRK
jgi:hypothetical protein